MQGHITVKQLQELSEEARLKFQLKHEPIMSPDLGDKLPFRVMWTTSKYPSKESYYLPLASIGELIGFLDRQEGFVLSIVRQITKDYKKMNMDKWLVMNIVDGKTYLKRNSLVGNLWDAVKDCLENDFSSDRGVTDQAKRVGSNAK